MSKQEEISLQNHISGQSNEPLSRPAHALSSSDVVQETQANADDGLTDGEAKSRLSTYGRNELGDGGGVQPVKILLGQFFNAMTLVLIMGMGVSFGIQSWIEAGVIAGVVIINVAVGFMQEYSAEKTMDSLRSLSSPTANAVRDGVNITVPTTEIVRGDMVELSTGDTVPADIRYV